MMFAGSQGCGVLLSIAGVGWYGYCCRCCRFGQHGMARPGRGCWHGFFISGMFEVGDGDNCRLGCNVGVLWGFLWQGDGICLWGRVGSVSLGFDICIIFSVACAATMANCVVGS